MRPTESRSLAQRTLPLLAAGLVLAPVAVIAAPAAASLLSCDEAVVVDCEGRQLRVHVESVRAPAAHIQVRIPTQVHVRVPAQLQVRPQIAQHLSIDRQALKEAVKRGRREFETALHLHRAEIEGALEIAELHIPAELKRELACLTEDGLEAGSSHPLAGGVQALVSVTKAPAQAIAFLQDALVEVIKVVPRVLRLVL